MQNHAADRADDVDPQLQQPVAQPRHLAAGARSTRRPQKGRDLITLGMKPGPAMGGALKKLFEKQIEGAIESREDALKAARRLVAE